MEILTRDDEGAFVYLLVPPALIGGDFAVHTDEGEAVVRTPIRSLVYENPEKLQLSKKSSSDSFNSHSLALGTCSALN